jgi:hypothetical protein
MSQLIQFKRGLKAALPSVANAGEPLFTTDTFELFVGTGTGVVPVVGVDENVKVGASGTKDYLSEDYFEQDGTNHIRIKQDTLLTGVDADKVDGKNVDDAQTSTSYLWTAGKIITYVQQFANGLDWQNSVLSIASVDPGTPAAGDRYLVDTGATGAFAGKDDNIAEFDGTAWTFIAPNPGFAVYVEDVNKQYTFNGTAWVNFGSTTNHNATSGLQGGTTNEYYHLTSAQHSGLTGGSATTLHTHNSDNITEGTTNLFFTDARAIAAVGGALLDTDSIDLTYSGGQISADLKKQNSDSINLSIDASGLKADLNFVDTNTVDLAVGASGLSADVRTQNTNSVSLSSDASGLKADLNVVDSDSIDFTVGVSGLTAVILKQNTPSVSLGIDASGLKADVNVDDASIKIDGTSNFIYVATVDGGSF